jgi:hypothetical protein
MMDPRPGSSCPGIASTIVPVTAEEAYVTEVHRLHTRRSAIKATLATAVP